MIIFLLEEVSMSVTLAPLIARLWPEGTPGVDWLALHFQGKQDLERNITLKMRNWGFGQPHFIVLRDQDGADCQLLKQKLATLATAGGRPFHIRIVCQELEGWFLGDLEAIEQAYPESNATNYANTAKFRDPDKLTNASQILEDLTKVSGKVGRASAIAEHLRIDQCRSASFQLVVNTVKSLIPG